MLKRERIFWKLQYRIKPKVYQKPFPPYPLPNTGNMGFAGDFKVVYWHQKYDSYPTLDVGIFFNMTSNLQWKTSIHREKSITNISSTCTFYVLVGYPWLQIKATPFIQTIGKKGPYPEKKRRLTTGKKKISWSDSGLGCYHESYIRTVVVEEGLKESVNHVHAHLISWLRKEAFP